MPDTENIEKNNQELVALYKASPGKTLGFQVLQRFMSDEQLGELLKSYQDNRKALGGSKNRANTLARPLDDAEMDALRTYLTEFDVPMKEISRRNNWGDTKTRSKIVNAAVRYLYQNKDLCGL